MSTDKNSVEKMPWAKAAENILEKQKPAFVFSTAVDVNCKTFAGRSFVTSRMACQVWTGEKETT